MNLLGAVALCHSEPGFYTITNSSWRARALNSRPLACRASGLTTVWSPTMKQTNMYTKSCDENYSLLATSWIWDDQDCLVLMILEANIFGQCRMIIYLYKETNKKYLIKNTDFFITFSLNCLAMYNYCPTPLNNTVPNSQNHMQNWPFKILWKDLYCLKIWKHLHSLILSIHNSFRAIVCC